MNTLLNWDQQLFLLLNGKWIHPVLDVLMPWITDFDHWRVPVILVLLVVLARGKADTRVGVLFAILAVIAADQVSSSILKPLFARPRPSDVVPAIAVRELIGSHSFAFPSSHAANTFAAGTFLALRFRRLWPILFLPLLVGYSRVYVGAHYPLDVVGGAIVGALIAIVFVCGERMVRRWVGRARG